MKHSLLRLSILALLLAIKTTVFAGVGDSFEVDGIAYLITSFSTVEVTHEPSIKYQGDIIITEVVTNNENAYSVTSIGYMTFGNCNDLTSVTIPNSVTSIDNSAFEGCSNLVSVTIGNSVTSIGYGAFKYCSSLASVIIPNSVTSIDEYAFFDCSGLTSVTIGNGLKGNGGMFFMVPAVLHQ